MNRREFVAAARRVGLEDRRDCPDCREKLLAKAQAAAGLAWPRCLHQQPPAPVYRGTARTLRICSRAANVAVTVNDCRRCAGLENTTEGKPCNC